VSVRITTIISGDSRCLNYTIGPLTAFSLASSIVQFIDFSQKIARLAKAFHDNYGELPADTARVSLMVQDIESLLRRLQTSPTSQNGSGDALQECTFSAVVVACASEAESFSNPLSSLKTAGHASGMASFLSTLKTLRHAGRIERCEASLQKYRSAISTRLAQASYERQYVATGLVCSVARLMSAGSTCARSSIAINMSQRMARKESWIQ
jgi:hypothetical protein